MKEGDNGIMWGETFIGRIYNWNSVVAQNSDVYDAIIPHAYAELANTNGMTQKNLVDHLAASCEEIYEGLLYQSMQFPGKEIWVTEWGSLGGAVFQESDSICPPSFCVAMAASPNPEIILVSTMENPQ